VCAVVGCVLNGGSCLYPNTIWEGSLQAKVKSAMLVKTKSVGCTSVNGCDSFSAITSLDRRAPPSPAGGGALPGGGYGGLNGNRQAPPPPPLR